MPPLSILGYHIPSTQYEHSILDVIMIQLDLVLHPGDQQLKFPELDFSQLNVKQYF